MKASKFPSYLSFALSLLFIVGAVPGVLSQTSDDAALTSEINQEAANDSSQDIQDINAAAEHMKKGEYSQAILKYSKILERRPNAGRVYLSRGTSYFFVQEFSKAKVDFEKASEIFRKTNTKRLYEQATNQLKAVNSVIQQ